MNVHTTLLPAPCAIFSAAYSLALGTLLAASAHAQHQLSRTPAFGSLIDSIEQADTVGDFDGDGRPDFLVGEARGSDFTVSVHRASDAQRVAQIVETIPAAQGLGWRAHGVGDVDNDGLDDIAITNPRLGRVAVYGLQSAAASAPPILLIQRGPGFGASVDGIDDFDGDGQGDIVVATSATASQPALIEIFSGRTASVLRSLSFGAPSARSISVTGLGRLNTDRVPDFGVVSTDAAGTSSATIFSGGTTQIQVVTSNLGATQLERAGDHDGNGIDDFLLVTENEVSLQSLDRRLFVPFYRATSLRLPTLTADIIGDLNADGVAEAAIAVHPGDGRASYVDIMDGTNGILLQRVVTGASGRVRPFGVGDADGDGVADLMVAVINQVNVPQAGVIDILQVGPTVLAPRERIFGNSCTALSALRPTMDAEGGAALGSTLRIIVRHEQIQGSSTLLIGNPAGLPLDLMGLPGCTLYVDPFAAIQRPLAQSRPLEVELRIPTDPSLTGTTLYMQWVSQAVRTSQSPLSVQLSAALEIVVGP